MIQGDPPKWALEQGMTVTSCPHKAALFRTKEGADAQMRQMEEMHSLGAGSFRVYKHKLCGYYHITKAGAYKAAWKAAHGGQNQAWDRMEELVMGKRVAACGYLENHGSTGKRRAWIVKSAAKFFGGR